MFENAIEADIYNMLVKNPGMAYVSHFRDKLYALVDPEVGMLCWTGDFTGMDDAAINDFIVKSCTASQN